MIGMLDVDIFVLVQILVGSCELQPKFSALSCVSRLKSSIEIQSPDQFLL